MDFLTTFGVVLAAAVFAGISAGVLGVYVIGLKMPFLAICTAHAALAGAVVAELAGFTAGPGAFIGACIGALLLTVLLRRRDIDINAALGVLFSVTIGIAFLGIGLSSGAKTGMFSLLWGSILFVTWGHVFAMLVVVAILLLFTLAFYKQLKLLLFNRELASLLIKEGLVLTALLLLASAIIAVNMEIVGGLLMFSLLSNPAIAALKLAQSLPGAFFLSAVFGIASALGGFTVAYFWNLPTGACIVLVSSLIVLISIFASRKERNP